MKFALVKDSIVEEILNDYQENSVPCDEMVRVGWTYIVLTNSFIPPKSPEGYSYDWMSNTHVPMSEEIAKANADFEAKQEEIRQGIAEPYITAAVDEYTLELMKEGVI